MWAVAVFQLFFNYNFLNIMALYISFYCFVIKVIHSTSSGSGKTYTMQPLPLKASQDILRLMDYTYRNQGFYLYVSFFEIYGGKLFDLLNDRRFVFSYYFFLFVLEVI